MRVISALWPYLLCLCVAHLAMGIRALAVELPPKLELIGMEAFAEKATEARAFVVGLGCVGAIPKLTRKEYRDIDAIKWPLSLDLSVSYPLHIAVQLNPIDRENGSLIVLVRQVNGEAPWDIVDIWIELKVGRKESPLPIPPKEIQNKVNLQLPLLLRASSLFGCAKDAADNSHHFTFHAGVTRLAAHR